MAGYLVEKGHDVKIVGNARAVMATAGFTLMTGAFYYRKRFLTRVRHKLDIWKNFGEVRHGSQPDLYHL